MNNLLKTAVKGLSFLVILRLFSKVIDFVLNILVIREIDPSIYGCFSFLTMRISLFILGLTIHFGLLLNLSLFYVKICLKNCYQKRSINPSSIEDPKMINYIIQQSSKNLVI